MTLLCRPGVRGKVQNCKFEKKKLSVVSLLHVSPEQEASMESIPESNRHLEDRYGKIKVIGRGTYCTVYKGLDRQTGQTVAIKIIDLDSCEDDMNDIMKEIIALRDCESKYVTKYYHSFNIGPELWIVMEYLGGGAVHDFLDAKHKVGLANERHIAIILREVAAGLAYLHSMKKIHRDIKAANILLTSTGEVKLADFGVVGQLTETIDKRMTMIGSPYWMAPEVIMQDAYDQSVKFSDALFDLLYCPLSLSLCPSALCAILQ